MTAGVASQSDLAVFRSLRRRGLMVSAGWLAGFAAVALCAADLQIPLDQVGRGVQRLGGFLAAMWPPNTGGRLPQILQALAETVAMALAATFIGAVVATPFAMLGSKALVPNAIIHFLVRRLLDVFRGVPALVWALILISALGLGPLAGVLALALEDAPRFAKLFAEATENADARPREAIKAAGGSWLAGLRYGLLPQTAPIWASQCLYFLEVNLRAAAVLGIVGAGGIGGALAERIRVFAFDQAIFIAGIYIVCVAGLDFISGQLRKRLQ